MGIDILEHHQQACLLLVKKHVVLNTEILIVRTERDTLQATVQESSVANLTDALRQHDGT